MTSFQQIKPIVATLGSARAAHRAPRAIASRNALRHGLTTERVILSDEQHRQLGLDICRGKRLQELRCVARRCRP
jgi:hypothetical protein